MKFQKFEKLLNRAGDYFTLYTCKAVDYLVTPSQDALDKRLSSAVLMDMPISAGYAIKKGANVNAGYKTNFSKYSDNTPLLIVAVDFASTDMMTLLIKNGIRMNDTDTLGKNALQTAIEKGARDKALVLMDNGAEIQIRNDILGTVSIPVTRLSSSAADSFGQDAKAELSAPPADQAPVLKR